MSALHAPVPFAQLVWKDGVPYASMYHDVYFSIENGLAEALHVFIEGNQLIQRFASLPTAGSPQFVVGETGFGSGLNFLLVWSLWKKHAPKNASLHYISCEQHPLVFEDLQACLQLWPTLASGAALLLENYPVLTPGFHYLAFDEGQVVLHLMIGEAAACYQERLLCGAFALEQTLRWDYVDAWFLDGFSPQRNAAMWSPELFTILGQLSRAGTTLSSYSVAKSVKEALGLAGFQCAKKKGYGRKREMLIGEWRSASAMSLKKKTPWHVGVRRPHTTQRAIVVGAGLAGACVANALAKRGWSVQVLDRSAACADGASGNTQAILFPMLSLIVRH